MPLKILLIAGARPNFMKIAPVIRQLEKFSKEINYKLIHTGQHYDRDMSEVFFEELEIPVPHYNLNVGSGSHAEQTANIILKFEQVCVSEAPNLVMVVGDVNSTLACSIVAKKMNIKVAHIEAGLRSGDMTMPEEINRIVTDSISDIYFVTEKSGVINLLAEGKKKEQIHFVGHVMIDNLYYQKNKLNDNLIECMQTTKIKERHEKYGIVTLHRPSNVDCQDALENIIYALNEVAKIIPLIFPIHPRTRENLDKYNILLSKQIMTTYPLPYMELLNLLKDAELVLTDSGGLQEETTALGIPCLTLRENTERPITVTDGTNVIVGVNPEKIISESENILNGTKKIGIKPELWDGFAAKRIVDVLLKYNN
jgi:UDP-N-acetylglucosamine 2-epimerase (non-hydrolysing)